MKEILTLECVLAVAVAAVAIAWTIRAARSFRERRRSAWNKRFVDMRFTPRHEDVKSAYSKYDQPTYLRTAQAHGETSAFLRRQAD